MHCKNKTVAVTQLGLSQLQLLDQYRSPISDRRVNNEVKSCRSSYVAIITGMLEDVQLHYNPLIARAMIVPLDYWTVYRIRYYIGSSSRAA